jgi:ribosomal protein S18 acetylase RimI-like enzyme
MTVVFRDFQVQELPNLEVMVEGLYREDPEGEPLSRDKIRSTVQALTEHPEKGRIVIFAMDADIVGYAIVIFYWSNEYGGDIVHIDELYVKPAWRNQGIASRFLVALPFRDMGAAKGLQLEVTPTNLQAQAYYHRLGFRPSVNTHLVKNLSG